MEKILGASNRLIEVDLSDHRVEEITVSDEDRLAYIGGRGLGLKLLSQRLAPGIDPLGEENWLVFLTGGLMGTGAPCSGRFIGVTKSPLTGIMAHAPCGGPFGLALKTAGYDGLLVTGTAVSPTVLVIDAKGVRFEDGTQLWGLDTRQTQKKLVGDHSSGALVIGPAGENRVRFANAASGHRFMRRGGFGAVMGAKRLKAILARGGDFQIVPKNIRLFKDTKRAAIAYIDSNSATSKVYPKFGTASHVNWCNKDHILPVNNFSVSHHEKAGNVSGEAISFSFKSFPQNCVSCRIGCGQATRSRTGNLRNIPDYDALVMLGPNLGIFDAGKIIVWHELCGLLGMDSISTGNVLGWSMEATEKGILKSPLSFGNPNGILKTIEEIAYRKELGAQLAKGVRNLSAQLGGSEYAMHVKGLELGAYDPRGIWGQGLGFAVANQGGCHQSAPLFALEAGLRVLPGCTTESKANWVFFMENFMAAITSLPMCPLTALALLPGRSMIKHLPTAAVSYGMTHLPVLGTKLLNVDIYARFFRAVMGERFSAKDLLRAGERIHMLERRLNTGEGIRRKDDTLPQRLLNEYREGDFDQSKLPLNEMLPLYYTVRGYDEEGVPLAARLVSLGIIDKDSVPTTVMETDTESDTAEKKAEEDLTSVAAGCPVSQTSLEESFQNDHQFSLDEPESDDSPTMVAQHGRSFTPMPSRLRRARIKIILWLLGRSLSALYRVDREAKQEYDDLPDDFIFALAATPSGPHIVIGKALKGRPQFLGMHPHQETVDLILQLKNVRIFDESIVFLGAPLRMFPDQHFIVRGDSAAACRVARILNITIIYLLPGPLAQKIVREYPNWSYKRKHLGRLHLGLRLITGT